MAKYGRKASEKVEEAMRERKRGTLESGRSGKKVTSRKQAIAIGLSEARREGGKVPPGPSSGRKTSGRKTSSRKTSGAKTSSRKTSARKAGAQKTARKKQRGWRRARAPALAARWRPRRVQVRVVLGFARGSREGAAP